MVADNPNFPPPPYDDDPPIPPATAAATSPKPRRKRKLSRAERDKRKKPDGPPPRPWDRPPKRKHGEGSTGVLFKQSFTRRAAEMAALGATDERIGYAFGVAEVTIRKWREKYPSFGAALKHAKDEADEKVIQSLFGRATGYSHPDVDIRVVGGVLVQTPIIKYYPPDATSCIFWLKNRRQLEFRDRQEITGANGAPIASGPFDPSKLSVKELLELQTMLEKAQPPQPEEKK